MTWLAPSELPTAITSQRSPLLSLEQSCRAMNKQLQFYRFQNGMTLADAMSLGMQLGFRVQHRASSTTFDQWGGLQPSDANRTDFESTIAIRNALNHMNGDKMYSRYISLSLCPLWPIWYILHRIVSGEALEDIHFIVIDLKSISESAALGIEIVAKAQAASKPKLLGPKWKHPRELTRLYDRTSSAQECLAYGRIPPSAILSILPMTEVLHATPPSFILSPYAQLSMIWEPDLRFWPWHEYLWTQGISQFRGFLHHCQIQSEENQVQGSAYIRMAAMMLYRAYMSNEEAVLDSRIVHLGCVLLLRFQRSSVVEAAALALLGLGQVLRAQEAGTNSYGYGWCMGDLFDRIRLANYRLTALLFGSSSPLSTSNLTATTSSTPSGGTPNPRAELKQTMRDISFACQRLLLSLQNLRSFPLPLPPSLLPPPPPPLIFLLPPPPTPVYLSPPPLLIPLPETGQQARAVQPTSFVHSCGVGIRPTPGCYEAAHLPEADDVALCAGELVVQLDMLYSSLHGLS